MSARLAKLAGTFALAALAGGCGFHPLYGRNGANAAGQQIFHTIYVDPIEAVLTGYELRNALIDSLEGANRPEHALYRLHVNVTQTLESVAVESTGSITRHDYTLTADYELTNIRTGRSISKGTETALQGFDVTGSPYSTLVAQHNAQRLGARAVADRIRIDLGIYFSKHAGG